jgi:probable phosphoglycerate mutase
VILVRHGESEHHIRRLTGGWTDTPLTTLGHEQAMRVAARLKQELGQTPVALYTSDLLRAGETARHIAAAFDVEPTTDERIREHNNGEMANLTVEEARVRYPAAFDQSLSLWSPDLKVHPVAGAETGAQFYERVSSFLDSLPADGPVPIVVTHGGTIMCLVARWLLMPPAAVAPISFSAHVTSITVLEGYPFRGLERLNDTAHLHGMPGYVPLRALV